MKIQKRGRNIIVFLFVVILCLYIWDIGVSDILPWTKTYFSSYSNYIRFLQEHSFYADEYFIDAVPQDSISVDYYCHQNFRKKYVAHSIVLDEKEYENTVESQKNLYMEYSKALAYKLVYALQNDECWNMDDMKENNVNVDFLSNIMQQSTEQQDYYCVIVFKMNTMHGVCYFGVIANDITHEMIEFSIEMPTE